MSVQGRITGWPVNDAGRPATLVAALAANAAQAGRQPGFREREYGIWREWTWVQVLDEVLALAAGFETLGLKPGHALTVVGDNRATIYFAMLAANALRAFPSPVYPDVPVEEFKNFVRFGDPDIALAEDQEQVDKLLDLRAQIGRPTTIVYDDPRGLAHYAEPGLIALSEVAERGRRRLAEAPGLAADLVSRAGADDTAVLLYSSGTTGLAKGIPLRHSNITGGIANAEAGGYFRKGERLFAYLPTAWVGDFVFSLAAGVLLQAVINIPERAETALHDLREVAPTFYLAAPRAWDAMLTRIQVGMADSTPLKRRLFDWFIPRAIELERKRLKGHKPTATEVVREWLGNLLVYAPLKDWLGLSRAERAFTGGEAMGEETFLFFRALGIQLKQFYGQTETCALTAAQVEGSVRIDTVGRAMPGVDVRIDDNGEILIRSASVFYGYADNPEATAEALTPDGYLRTGDAGRVQPGGDLVVLGRVSELVETAQGERFIPTFIENRLKFSPYIRNIAVLGAGRDDLTAIVCIDYEATGHWAEQRSLSYSSYAELSQKPEVIELITTEIARVNELQPDALRIRRFVNLHKDFDADDGEITRTRKLRRKVIEQTYARLIDALYGGAREVTFDAKITYEDGRQGTLSRNLSIREV
ncbi:long-chain acyl-CoA synthetase [Gemmobacter megaterium]|uniref:Long-chain acyl-CoA synthetase n=1 Tax=Gemmobacter megaterium TaxID=1086013 RepID=A0A1N7K9N2_9RHOB|nr:AMP-binding protein [Gemmobacter megaterium]GGE01016.1 long-chain-fatty-acid--CoA ligase [Gemmobacter megaterium]SIS58287.1 long-chain acyl-CoA synthetase [Gemmobacter megaterium]